MISNIAARPAAYQPVRASLPEPAICPKPMDWGDHVDFSSIDTAAKAAATPALDPAVQLGLAAGVAAMIFAAMGGGAAPAVTYEVTSKTGGNESTARYSFVLDNPDQPLQVSGEFAGQALSGGLVVDEEARKAGWQGQIGSNADEISVVVPENQDDIEELRFQTKFGSVEGDLTASPLLGQGGSDDYQGYKIEGTLGGQPYSLETRWELPEELKNGQPPQGGDKVEVQLHSTGSLGDQPIQRDYTAVGTLSDNGATVELNGSGNIAGIPQETHAVLSITL